VIDAQVKAFQEDPSQPDRDLQQPMMKQFELASQIVKSAEIERHDESVVLIATIGEAPTVVAELVPQIMAAREAARRVQSLNNLKQLGLAAYNYHDSFGSFPPAVIYGKSAYGDMNPTGDKADDVPRSWRVELLPMLGYQELYKQYRLDEPWDSDMNRKVLAQMPTAYRAPADKAGSQHASYFALVGAGTIFDDRDGTKVTEITDGTSNTLLFVEAKRDTPWTKPEDVAYGVEKLPELGGWQEGVFLAALADGSARIFKPSGLGDGLRAWIEKADGKVSPLEGQE
jgi:hypothetical protein